MVATSSECQQNRRGHRQALKTVSSRVTLTFDLSDQESIPDQSASWSSRAYQIWWPWVKSFLLITRTDKSQTTGAAPWAWITTICTSGFREFFFYMPTKLRIFCLSRDHVRINCARKVRLIASFGQVELRGHHHGQRRCIVNNLSFVHDRPRVVMPAEWRHVGHVTGTYHRNCAPRA